MTYEESKNKFNTILFTKKILDKAIEQYNAEACMGCAFISTATCCKCARNCKDYWRKASE